MGMKGLMSMTNLLRWVVVAVATVHGLIHLLGAAVRFGWVDDPTPDRSVGMDGGVLWLVAAGLMLVTALLAALGVTLGWWIMAVGAAIVSQIAIIPVWAEAKSGSLVNVLLVLIVVYSVLARGPSSLHGRWARQSAEALAEVNVDAAPVLESDLDGLPTPVAAYIRRSGAVGRPKPVSLHAEFRGRIRSGPDAPSMSFTGRQVNTFGANPRRLFIVDTSKFGLPVTVLHEYVNATATMRGKLLSLVQVLDAFGPEMDQGETVTVFNDLVLLAPGAIPGAPVTWTSLDDHQVRGVFTNAGQTVSAVLTFGEDDDLVDFVSEDRFRASEDGKSFTRQPWSTPVSKYVEVDGRRVLQSGTGRWRDSLGWFTYVEMRFDEVLHNVSSRDESVSSSLLRNR